ncbi:hypothetical protein L0F63_003915 [Massospora cicadina]|nr:hypothetical protein L0F63_003915 [Massospora cicadina]
MGATFNCVSPRLLCPSGINSATLRKLSLGAISTRSQLFSGLNATRRVGNLTLLPLTPVHVSKSNYAFKKEKWGKKGIKVETEEGDYELDGTATDGQEESLKFDINSYAPKFQACLDNLKRDFYGLRLGRANPAILDLVVVDCGEEFGGMTPLKQVGQVAIKDPQTLIINVFEPKLLPKVEKAIFGAGLNLAPVIEAGRIRVPIPRLNAKSRDETVRLASQLEQKAKTSSRLVRHTAMKVLANLKRQKASGISIDDVKILEREVEAMTAKYNVQIEALTAAKLLEIKQ